MTIRIYRDRIELGDFVLRETADGASFDGEVAAQQFLGTGFQGTVSGYTAGGNTNTPAGFSNVIDKFPFAANANATDVGDLTTVNNGPSGNHSPTSGYSSGGREAPPSTSTNRIEKFPFAVDTNSVDSGADLLVGTTNAGEGHSSSISGYVSGGYAPGLVNTIQKFAFATSSNGTDVGDLLVTTSDAYGMSSYESGYKAGGTIIASPNTLTNSINKFPFATDSNATDVGDLSGSKRKGAGISSSISGYAAGGAPAQNTIEKFPFSANANATDVGDLTRTNTNGAVGTSSTQSGYASGGYSGINVIERFPFATDTNATDVGDLTQGRYQSSSQQN